MNNVFPEAMNPLPDDPKEAVKVMEKYIRYMTERIDFAFRRERGLTEVPEAEVVERLIRLEGEEAQTAQKANSAYQTANNAYNGLELKVDKETGKVLSSNDYTDSDKLKLGGLVDVEANPSETPTTTMTTVRVGDTVYELPSGGTYTLPLAADGTRGGIQLGYTASGKNYPVKVSSEKAYVNVPWENTTYSAATTSAAGLMSAADKTKLNGIATGATKVTVDSSMSSSSTNPVQNKIVNSAIADKVKFISASKDFKSSSSAGGAWQYTGLSIEIPSGYKALVAITGGTGYKALSTSSSPSKKGVWTTAPSSSSFFCGYVTAGTKYLHMANPTTPGSTESYSVYALCVKN